MAGLKTNLKARWKGGIAGEGTLKVRYLDTNIAIPIDLKGSGNGADPKELLVSAAAACYMATLVSILENRKLPIGEHTLYSDATLIADKLAITHYPEIVLTADATKAQIQSAERALKAADRICNIGNLLKKADVAIELMGTVSVNENK